jgi:hypothetical protein
MLQENVAGKVADSRRENVENARFSADTLSRDAQLKNIARAFSGILGVVILFRAIANTIYDLKHPKKNPWIFSRVILEFTASGILIGYSLSHILIGMSLGFFTGAAIVLVELKVFKKNARNFAFRDNPAYWDLFSQNYANKKFGD